MRSVYDEPRGLLVLGGPDDVDASPRLGPPMHPFLAAGAHSFCAYCPTTPRCDECPIADAELAERRELLKSGFCPVCLQPAPRAKRRWWFYE